MMLRTEDGENLTHLLAGDNRKRMMEASGRVVNNFMREHPNGMVEIVLWDMETGLRVDYQSHKPTVR
jgi:hypothetical protein